MKTVKHIKDNRIERKNDEKAEELVKSGNYKYIPKMEWKELRTPKKK